MKFSKSLFVGSALCLAIGFACGIYVGKSRGIPFTEKVIEWSIGIYIGGSPFDLKDSPNVKNPVLTAKDVTDVSAEFVSDPFMVFEGNTWYMFFEILNASTGQGDIAYAKSDDAFNWTYGKTVLDESFHLSYPYVFKHKNEYYMIPESYQAWSVRLYKAVNFPMEWTYVTSLLHGNFVDSSLFQYENKFWLFAETNPTGNDRLSLYFADDLMGPWEEHPKSPILKKNADSSRPGGRVLIYEGRVYRYTQDDFPTYGNQVSAFEITRLTPTEYEEKRVDKYPVIGASGKGWNGLGMHHVDPYEIEKNYWIACVDGKGVYRKFGFQY